jgi:hypothetical protein
MNGYSSESVNTLLHKALLLTDSMFSAALSWFTIAVSSVFSRMGGGATNRQSGYWLPVSPEAGAGALLEGVLGSPGEEGGGREDENV